MSPTEGAERVREILDAAEEMGVIDPEPLVAPHEEPRPYPVDALPSTIRAAVTTYQEYGQQPIPLVASSALSVAALSTQGLVNVGRDRNLIGPISLNQAVIAESGERKTSADRRMKRPAQRWQEKFRTDHVAEVAAAESRVAAWRAQREGILAKIKSTSGRKPTADGLSIAELKLALTALEVDKPHGLTIPALFYEDASPEALAQEMATGWPSAALWSDEGALVVGFARDVVERFRAPLLRVAQSVLGRQQLRAISYHGKKFHGYGPPPILFTHDAAYRFMPASCSSRRSSSRHRIPRSFPIGVAALDNGHTRLSRMYARRTCVVELGCKGDGLVITSVTR